ncbi:helix-turn-helix domain-containing protein [Rhodococcus sp. KRD197]|uniref:helix-turn-helix domain-containing protein n=1 Tax=Rhodococcus sp. KRD197 TaxID=2729731 RepID=UPI0019D01414|nr:helix-turn-helix domain-containing protein [Rhodococcus sp. KRD197]
MERARRAAAIASDVFGQVKQQAVYALAAEGLSVRAIADRTGIPKSEVSRISRRLTGVRVGRDAELPKAVGAASTTTPHPSELREQVREQVRAAWGHR